MIVEIPTFRRCCCCLPLRRGILAFGYINLLLTIAFCALQLLVWIIIHNHGSGHAIAMYRGVEIEAHIFFVIALHVLDIVFNLVLIIGAHKQSSKLMRAYYYYQLTTMIASFLVLLVTYGDISRVGGWAIASTELCVAFLGFVIQTYLLLLVRSELNKVKYQEGRTSYVNQMAEVFVEPPMRHDRRNLL
ncbi:uncharacterized protein LOC142977118 [Anticarsia gemmatalis]|uniref:uncharacterized protein LOC142977118 n=1 Tax=Anticarsia gemmatalis TaxID=129554 RepID=UPI003F75CB38